MMRIVGIAGLLLACTALPSHAQPQENFGRFVEKSLGQWALVDGVSSFVTAKPVLYIDPNGLEWPVPTEWPSDGASIPWPFWSMIGHPFGDIYVDAAIVHDFYCERNVRTDEATHQMFYYASRALGVPEWKADLMYWAVATFGPKWDLLTEAHLELQCHTVNGHEICEMEWVGGAADVDVAMIDFSDPALQAAALAKFAAVARTLKTSGGAILDISAAGQVGAGTLADIDANAAFYRDLFVTGQATTDPEMLGLLSSFQPGLGTDPIAVWAGDSLPTLDAAPQWDMQAGLDNGFVLDNQNMVMFTPDLLGVETQGLDLRGMFTQSVSTETPTLSDFLALDPQSDIRLDFGSELLGITDLTTQSGTVTVSDDPIVIFNAPTAQQRLVLEGIQQFQIENGVQLRTQSQM